MRLSRIVRSRAAARGGHEEVQREVMRLRLAARSFRRRLMTREGQRLGEEDEEGHHEGEEGDGFS